ncbi:metallophosphoesterase family protein [Pseudomonas japonica]|uniref:metallophosphoesterase family protein n=1 Tax=Pseudomonas japonica TaxID=256466 RepID=UPI0015E2E72D|nr:metallophosphoesterase family protein [Pseudomonas japonica]MBA1245123.1 metallophosphoesterase family protein [Pseudomonas japonica]MBA1289465.1 metallophosphoesterase family protein [Pseudomonas japonica]
MKIGLIADTHGLLRPEALAALQGCDHLIHAGDIGKPDILDQLRAIAPLSVVRGNNDRGLPWADGLPDHLLLDLGGLRIYLTHELADVPWPLPGEATVVVTGHSHKPLIAHKDGALHINPGSAGPRRFKLPVSVALLEPTPAGPHARLVPLG